VTTAREGKVVIPDFDALYRTDPDPWRVESSWYERRKLSLLLAALPRERYASIWEPGCGPGIISEQLAQRADRLLGTDASEEAIHRARLRCDQLDHVSFLVSALPAVPMQTRVELVVAAEFLYYLEDFELSLATIWSRAEPGGHVAFLHWVHHPDDAFRSGRSMHGEIALNAVGRDAVRVVSHEDTDFQLDIYEMP
jgi:trans-aconitate methyltransferase